MEKLHKLVYVHYNMRLRLRNLMYAKDDEDYCNPIDLNNIFENDDVLGDWIREVEPPLLPEEDLDTLDESFEQAREDLRRSGYDRNEVEAAIRDKRKEMQQWQRDTGKRATDGGPSRGGDDDDDGDGDEFDENDEFDDDDDDDGGRDRGKGGHGGGSSGGDNYASEPTGGMSWAQGNENYYATQDTDHGYRPGIDEQRRRLALLPTYPSSDECGHLPHPGGYRGIHEQMQSLGFGLHNQPHRHSVSSLGGYRQHEFGGYGYDAHRHSYGTSYGGHGYGGYGQHYASSNESNVGPSRLGRSNSTTTGGYFDRMRHNEGSIGSDTVSGSYYGQGDVSSGASSDGYRGFGYYQQGGHSNQLPEPTGSSFGASFGESLFSYPYNCPPNYNPYDPSRPS